MHGVGFEPTSLSTGGLKPPGLTALPTMLRDAYTSHFVIFPTV